MQARLGKLELQRAKAASEKSLTTLTQQKGVIETQLVKLNQLISKAGKERESRENQKCALT